MIDNLQFVKFVLENRSMTEGEKALFLDAAPKMTQMEKAEYIWTVLALQVADLSEEIDEKELEALREGKDIESVLDTFLASKAEKIDAHKIEQIRSKLKAEILESPQQTETNQLNEDQNA